MLALYRSGRQVEALHVFTEFRRRLADAEGLDPGPRARRPAAADPRAGCHAARTRSREPAAASRPFPDQGADRARGRRGIRPMPDDAPAPLSQDPVHGHRDGVSPALWPAASAFFYPRPPVKGAAPSLPTIAVTGNSAVALDAQSGRVVGDYPVGTHTPCHRLRRRHGMDLQHRRQDHQPGRRRGRARGQDLRSPHRSPQPCHRSRRRLDDQRFCRLGVPDPCGLPSAVLASPAGAEIRRHVSDRRHTHQPLGDQCGPRSCRARPGQPPSRRHAAPQAAGALHHGR